MFGLAALRYPLGEFSRAGPGLFPLMVSCLLFVIGLTTVVRSRFVEHVHIQWNLKNIAIIAGGPVAGPRPSGHHQHPAASG